MAQFGDVIMIDDDQYRQGRLVDFEIDYLAKEKGMISPYVDHCVTQNERGEPAISYGLSSMGYDIRPDRKFKIISTAVQDGARYLDPKNTTSKDYIEYEGDSIFVPPNGLVLAVSMEYFRMPDDVCAIAVAKSTYARVGLTTLCTPLEPGWEGNLVIEMANTTSMPIRLYAGEGVVQLLFDRGPRPKVTYKDRKGKYQGQTGITLSRV